MGLFETQLAQYTTQNISGEDKIALVNGVKSYLPELKIDGNTYQHGYTGYNLAYATSNNRSVQYVTVEYLDTNNFIIRPNNKTTTSSKYAGFTITAKPNTTYRVTANIKRIGTFAGQSSAQCFNNGVYISGSTLYITSETVKYNMTVKTSSDTNRLYVQFNLMGGVAVGEENDIEFVVENFMIIEGSADKTYEPYVGGKAAPNPDYPQDIINAGDNEVEVEVKGKNLFDIDNPVLAANSEYNLPRKPEVRDGVIYFNTYYSIAGGAGYVVPMEPNTTFVISWEKVEGDYYTEFFNFESLDSNGIMQNWERFTNSRNATSVKYRQPENKHYILLLLDCVGGYKKAGIKNLQVEISDSSTAYEPYFKSTISIPSTVGDLELRFAKYDDTYKDSLLVDGVNKKVIYKQMLDRVVVPASKWIEKYYYANSMGILAYSALPYECSRNKGFCSHARPVKVGGVDTYSAGAVWIGVGGNIYSSKAIYWVGIISLLGYDSEWVDKKNPTTEEMNAAISKFKTWLKEQEANGHPFECVFVMPKPIEHDLTNSDFGQQLLNLIVQRGVTILELTNSLPQKISAKYIVHAGCNL